LKGNSDFKSNIGSKRYERFKAFAQDLKNRHPEYANIPDDELIAIRGYTSEFPKDYATINKALRENDVNKIEEYKSYIKNIENGLEKLPGYEGTVFRGEDMDAARFARDFKNASEYKTTQFFSTSHKKGFGGNTRFTVASKNGKNIAPISEFGSTEFEVLYPKGTEFKILEAIESGGKYNIVLKEM
jgi:hypothetical protein